jgi:transposase
MKSKKVTLRSKRLYSEEFKRAQVKEYESGNLTVSEIGKLYGIAEALIYRWIQKFSTYNKRNISIVEMKESSSQKIKELQDRIKELERAVGLKQLNIDFLEKMIELAQTELDVDIKKNFASSQSGGIKKTEGKSLTK